MCTNTVRKQLIEDRDHNGKISKTNFRDMILNNEDISNIDYSHITDMSFLFSNCTNLETIPHLDVSNVTNMEGMFEYCKVFDGDVSNWDVSSVTNMKDMFLFCRKFNQNLNDWDVSNVVNMESMFRRCSSFNKPLNRWDVSNVVNMKGMFSYSFVFNQDLNDWDVSNVTDMNSMFYSPKSTIMSIYEIFQNAANRVHFTTPETLELLGYQIHNPEPKHTEPHKHHCKKWKLNKDLVITNMFYSKELFCKTLDLVELLNHVKERNFIDLFSYNVLEANKHKNSIALKISEIIDAHIIKPD